MLNIATILKHYKNKEVQQRMVDASKEREVAVRFLKGFFGKRPDSLLYKGDILEFAKKQVSSFHVSEEIWGNVNVLSQESGKINLDKTRKGWDFILDVDCPDWELSKLITHLLIKALMDHGVNAISLKFSGNKGFHIAVPFESFPEEVFDVKTSTLFPEVPRQVSEYLISYIEDKYVNVDGFNISFDGHKYNINAIAKTLGKESKEMYNVFCSDCDENIKNYDILNKKEEDNEFVCELCQKRIFSKKEIESCPKCNIVMDKFEGGKKAICNCGSKSSPYFKFNARSVIEVDTLLISTRHLYRLVYSLHEKSSLSSIPIEISRVLEFEKEEANPLTMDISKHPIFLDKNNLTKGEAESLVLQAFKGKEKIVSNKSFLIRRKRNNTQYSNTVDGFLEEEKTNEQEIKPIDIESLKEKEELFPPCIKLLLNGIYDGKKRAVFALVNFFKSIGVKEKDLENLLIDWNKNNPEPLKEGIMIGQLKYRVGRKAMLPPNCDNRSYYIDIGVCKKDNLCNRIKNPVNYYNVKHRDKYGEEEDSKKKRTGRPKLSEKQLAMRKAYREKLKQEKTMNKENLE